MGMNFKGIEINDIKNQINEFSINSNIQNIFYLIEPLEYICNMCHKGILNIF